MSPTVHALDRARALSPETQKPSRAEVEAAFRTIIRWTGDHPERDGLLETPARVTRAFEEFFAGYDQDPVEILEKTFEEIEGYDVPSAGSQVWNEVVPDVQVVREAMHEHEGWSGACKSSVRAASVILHGREFSDRGGRG